jgi:hypothetical protein
MGLDGRVAVVTGRRRLASRPLTPWSMRAPKLSWSNGEEKARRHSDATPCEPSRPRSCPRGPAGSR